MKYYHIRNDIFIEFSDNCSKGLEDNNIFLDMSDPSKYLRRRVNKKKFMEDINIFGSSINENSLYKDIFKAITSPHVSR